jgi:hypothetical protein
MDTIIKKRKGGASKKRQPKPNPNRLPEQSEWTFDLIEQAHGEIRRVAQNFGLDTYPNQLEIISSEQMMDAYASVGMPVSYHHWSFGKQFVSTEKSYKGQAHGVDWPPTGVNVHNALGNSAARQLVDELRGPAEGHGGQVRVEVAFEAYGGLGAQLQGTTRPANASGVEVGRLQEH